MVASDCKSITVTACLPYSQVRIGHLYTSGYGCGTSVYAVEAISIHIIRKPGGASDSRYYDVSLLAVAQSFRHIRKGTLQSRKHSVVTAARAPSHLLVTLEFLECISWHNCLFILFHILVYRSYDLLDKERLALHFIELPVLELREFGAEPINEMS